MVTPPIKPDNSFRVTLELASPCPRLDGILLEELRKQDRNPKLKTTSRSALKAMFKAKKIQIKGQDALPSSALAAGVTYVDLLGFEDQ